jgi:hypothetical protein
MVRKTKRTLLALGLGAVALAVPSAANAGWIHVWWTGIPYQSGMQAWAIYCDSGALYASSGGTDPGTPYTVDYYDTGDC